LLGYQGYYGYYWGSSDKWFARFDSGNRILINYYSRAYGFSLRCVAVE
jgi:hypothetical protein